MERKSTRSRRGLEEYRKEAEDDRRALANDGNVTAYDTVEVMAKWFSSGSEEKTFVFRVPIGVIA